MKLTFSLRKFWPLLLKNAVVASKYENLGDVCSGWRKGQSPNLSYAPSSYMCTRTCVRGATIRTAWCCRNTPVYAFFNSLISPGLLQDRLSLLGSSQASTQESGLPTDSHLCPACVRDLCPRGHLRSVCVCECWHACSVYSSSCARLAWNECNSSEKSEEANKHFGGRKLPMCLTASVKLA